MPLMKQLNAIHRRRVSYVLLIGLSGSRYTHILEDAIPSLLERGGEGGEIGWNDHQKKIKQKREGERRTSTTFVRKNNVSNLLYFL